MHRRDFAKSTILGLALGAAGTVAARASTANPNENIVFTEEDPGHWAKVAALHVPQTSLANGTLTVKTPHPQSDAHYIVSHTVVLGDGAFLARKTFTSKDEPTSTHALPAGYSGKVTVTSSCNLHDYWAKTITV